MGACQFLIGCEDTAGGSVRVNYSTTGEQKENKKEEKRGELNRGKMKSRKLFEMQNLLPRFFFFY